MTTAQSLIFQRMQSYKNNPNKRAHSIIFSDILADLVQAQIKAETLSNEMYIHPGTRHRLGETSKRINSILLIFKMLIGHEGYQALYDQLINDDSVLQIMGIKGMFMLMTNDQRDVAEEVNKVLCELSPTEIENVLHYAKNCHVK